MSRHLVLTVPCELVPVTAPCFPGETAAQGGCGPRRAGCAELGGVPTPQVGTRDQQAGTNGPPARASRSRLPQCSGPEGARVAASAHGMILSPPLDDSAFPPQVWEIFPRRALHSGAFTTVLQVPTSALQHGQVLPRPAPPRPSVTRRTAAGTPATRTRCLSLSPSRPVSRMTTRRPRPCPSTTLVRAPQPTSPCSWENRLWANHLPLAKGTSQRPPCSDTHAEPSRDCVPGKRAIPPSPASAWDDGYLPGLTGQPVLPARTLAPWL